MTIEFFKQLVDKYNMRVFYDNIGVPRGVQLDTEHHISELDQIVLRSTTEYYPAFCHTFAPDKIRYEIHAPSAWFRSDTWKE